MAARLRPPACDPKHTWSSLLILQNYDPKNREHVAILDEIIIGNGLPRGNRREPGLPISQGLPAASPSPCHLSQALLRAAVQQLFARRHPSPATGSVRGGTARLYASSSAPASPCCSYKEAEAAGKSVGFKLVESRDIAGEVLITGRCDAALDPPPGRAMAGRALGCLTRRANAAWRARADGGHCVSCLSWAGGCDQDACCRDQTVAPGG